MGTVFGKNITSSSITVAGHKVYYIDSTNAEKVEVQDGNNVKYNSFKYLLSGTSYWYVIDGVHDAWTDDLSALGYSEVPVGPVLPMVTLFEELGTENVLVTSGSSTGVLHTWGAGSWVGPAMVWDSTKAYSSTTYTPGDGRRYSSCGVFEPVEVTSGGTGYIGAKNISSSSQTFRNFIVAICSSDQATVILVYGFSNNAYNAFKYMTNNMDYYYVLDGIQTDWTNDLSSIGYSLTPQVKVAYMTNSGVSATSDTQISPTIMYHTSNVIYNSLGSEILFDNTKTYTFSAAYNKSGDLVSFGGTPEIGQYFSSGYLGFGVWGNGGTSSVFRIEYTES